MHPAIALAQSAEAGSACAPALPLCHYAGTRQDETNLHRNLTPYRAKGREWYEDCQLIADMVRQAVELHGPPYITASWTVPVEKPLRARKGSRSKPSGLSI